jgi:plastocyanin
MRSMLCKTRTALVVATFGLASASAWATTWQVNVGDPNGHAFTPQTLNISAGDTVTWTNGGGFHSVLSDPGAVTSFTSGAASSAPWTLTVTFPTPGTAGYHCIIHGAPGQGMFGTINVTVPVDLQSFKID